MDPGFWSTLPPSKWEYKYKIGHLSFVKSPDDSCIYGSWSWKNHTAEDHPQAYAGRILVNSLHPAIPSLKSHLIVEKGFNSRVGHTELPPTHFGLVQEVPDLKMKAAMFERYEVEQVTCWAW